MSDIPPEDIPLFTAIRLVRLRDRMHGKPMFTSAFFRGLKDEEDRDKKLLADIELVMSKGGLTLDSSIEPQLDASEIELGKPKLSGAIKVSMTYGELLEYSARKYEYVHGAWESTFTSESDAVEKFLNLLEGLRLNVSSERKELNTLRDESESILQRLAVINARIKKGKNFDDVTPVFNDMFEAMAGLNTLSDTVNKMADEAIRIVALMTSSIQSQRLLELFTGEP